MSEGAAMSKSGSVLPRLPSREQLAPQWRSQGFADSLTLGEEVRAGIARHPDTMLIFGSRDRPSSASISALYSDAVRFASVLASRGYRPGDVLVAQLPNWRESAVSMLAALHIGLVFIPVIHIYGPSELGFLLRQSNARGLIIPDSWRGIDFVARVDAISALPSLQDVFLVGAGTPGSCGNWHDAVESGTNVAAHHGDPDDVFLISFTSGTSGVPKGVLHTHRSLATETRSFPLFPKPGDEQGPMFWMLPGGHIGATVSMLRPFLCNESAVYIDQFEGPLSIELVRAHRPRRVGGVPFHLTTLFDSAEAADLSSIDHASTGGAGVPPELILRGERLGISISRCFGLTEHPTITSCSPADPIHKRAHTDGKPIGGSLVRIIDDDGAECPRSTAGEIVTIGPELCRGYLDPAMNGVFTAEGWFRTGDIGIVDDEGYLAVIDRKKDIIIRGGENIASREVELILANHPVIVEAAAVAWPHPQLGECVGVFLRLEPGTGIDLAAIQHHFRKAGVAKQKTPEHIVIIDEFPRSLIGKILKAELRRRIPTIIGTLDQDGNGVA
jgi:acyl-CoA synthetase (AMP-forming)/AMP-acid ligase II